MPEMKDTKSLKLEELDGIVESLLSEARSRSIYNVRDLLNRDWGSEISRFVSEDFARGGRLFNVFSDPRRKKAVFQLTSKRAPIYEVPYAYFFLVFRPFIMLKDFTVDYPQVKVFMDVHLNVICHFEDIFKLIGELERFKKLFEDALNVDYGEASSWASYFADRIRHRVWYFVREPSERASFIEFKWKVEAVYKILSPGQRELALRKFRYNGISTALEEAVNEIGLREIIMGKFEEFKDVAKELVLQFQQHSKSLQKVNDAFKRHIALSIRHTEMEKVAIVVYKFLVRYIEEVVEIVNRYTNWIAHDFLHDVLVDKTILNFLFEKGGIWDEVDLIVNVKRTK
jgi:hypothetical protein